MNLAELLRNKDFQMFILIHSFLLHYFYCLIYQIIFMHLSYSEGVKEQPTMQGFEDRADLAAGGIKDIGESEMLAIKGELMFELLVLNGFYLVG